MQHQPKRHRHVRAAAQLARLQHQSQLCRYRMCHCQVAVAGRLRLPCQLSIARCKQQRRQQQQQQQCRQWQQQCQQSRRQWQQQCRQWQMSTRQCQALRQTPPQCLTQPTPLQRQLLPLLCQQR
jgi:hypothetical protein